MSKFAVGDTVILTNVNQRGHREVPVVRVGRKYVYIEWFGREKAFDFKGHEVGDYSHCSIYTLTEWAQKARRTEVVARLRKDHGVSFDWQHGNRISTAVMERVLAVLEAEEG